MAVAPLVAPPDPFEIIPTTSDFELLDAHVHPMNRAYDGSLYYDSSLVEEILPRIGIGGAVIMVDGPLHLQRERIGALVRKHRWMVPVTWIRPGHDSPNEVESLIAAGFRGLKMHPTVDGYDADDPVVDPYLSIAQRYGVPVQIHSALDDQSRPERIAALARRFPEVPVIVVHFELGAYHKHGVTEIVRRVPNLYAETSWTNPDSILEAFRILGSDRTIFGTDATVDGPTHFDRTSVPDCHGRFIYSYPDVVAEVKRQSSPTDFYNWARGTATRLYNLRIR